MHEREPFNLPMKVVEETDPIDEYVDLVESTAKKLLMSQFNNRKSNEFRLEIKKIFSFVHDQAYNKGLKDMDRMHSITNDTTR